MEATIIRKELHDYIDNSSDNVVETLLQFLKAKSNYIVEEDSVDLGEYNIDIDIAMDEFAKGNYTSHEDVKQALKLL